MHQANDNKWLNQVKIMSRHQFGFYSQPRQAHDKKVLKDVKNSSRQGLLSGKGIFPACHVSDDLQPISNPRFGNEIARSDWIRLDFPS
jgi:hypothetical protein